MDGSGHNYLERILLRVFEFRGASSRFEIIQEWTIDPKLTQGFLVKDERVSE